jgi:hypothetical protein
LLIPGIELVKLIGALPKKVTNPPEAACGKTQENNANASKTQTSARPMRCGQNGDTGDSSQNAVIVAE